MKTRVRAISLVAFLFTGLGLNSARAQAKNPATVFRPALEEIQSKTLIPILLPSKLPSFIRGKNVWAAGEVRDDGYFISLYFAEPGSVLGSDATFAAGFSGSKLVFRHLGNTRRVALSGGRTGMFRAVSCGGSCAPANLWWEEKGVMYQIQIKLRTDLPGKDQETILVETANSVVVARRE